jgi:predicted transcriptional regulator
MSDSSTLTVRLPAEVKDRLGRLAQGARRTRSFLAAEAIAAYVERESAIVEAVEEGLRDMRAGRVVPHERVEAELEELIARAEAHGRP